MFVLLPAMHWHSACTHAKRTTVTVHAALHAMQRCKRAMLACLHHINSQEPTTRSKFRTLVALSELQSRLD